MSNPTQSASYMRLLPRESTSAVGRLELLARGLVEGFMTGRHRSPHKGFSVEFAEHRQYVPGDDTNDIDWRVFGKIDRYYIKQYTEETNLRATILLDASGSMSYTGEKSCTVSGEKVSKFQYGQYLAAALSYMMIRQQDAVGLVTFDDDIRKYIPARSRASQVRHLLNELDITKPGGETGIGPILHNIAERIHRRGVVIIISDLFDRAEEIIKGLYHFAYRKHEIVVFHVMAEEELKFDFSKFMHFRNLELRDDLIQLDARTIRAEYLERLNEFILQIKRGCGEMKADYVPVCTSEGFDGVLARFVTGRRSVR